MRSQYSTLTLGVDEEQQAQNRSGKFAAAGLVLVALAGSAAVLSGTTTLGAPRAAVNPLTAPYDAKAGDIAPCGGLPLEPVPQPADELAYLNTLPRWDPYYSTQDDFYNSCYFSFRCCTLTGPGDGGCYVSDNFGDACRTCLKMNAPTMVAGVCATWLADGQRASTDQIDTNGTFTAAILNGANSTLPPIVDPNASASSITDATTRQTRCEEDYGESGDWNMNNGGSCPEFSVDQWSAANQTGIEEGITCADACKKTYAEFPTLGDYNLQMMLKTGPNDVPADRPGMLNSCWVRPGAEDPRIAGNGGYADKCFEVISWCNLLCPRDTPQTVDHVMCKHCTLFGFRETSWDSQSFTNELTAMQADPTDENAAALLAATAAR